MSKLSILSWNIRGFGKLEKRGATKKVLKEKQVKVGLFQEAKLESCDASYCRSFWGSTNLDFAFSPAIGASGGLVTVWDPSFFVGESRDEERSLLTVIGNVPGIDFKVGFINVYAPNNFRERIWVFEEILEKVKNQEVKWCVGGDFNSIKEAGEKFGKSFNDSEAKAFTDFIDESGLIDLPLIDGPYTWGGKRGQEYSWSRLDRFLISPEIADLFPNIQQSALPRSVSDHNPILLEVAEADWGPRPFKFFNSCLDEEGCAEAIEQASSKSKGKGIAKTLKCVKVGIKKWFEGKRNDIPSVQTIEKKIDVIEKEIQAGLGTKKKLESLQSLKQELWCGYRKIERDWHQKSRLKWRVLGDKNSKFYHLIASGRKRWNKISKIKVGSRVLSSPKEIKTEVARYFRKQFEGQQCVKVKEFGCKFEKISEQARKMLESPFEEEEVWDCLRWVDDSKAPGPDGFNLGFIKKNWSALKEEIMAVLREFYSKERWDPNLNQSFITLIPKGMSPETLNEYRPISLVGVIYKLLSKVLAKRLGQCIEQVVDEHQFAFIKGRQLTDCSFIANEIIHQVSRSGEKAVVFKADFQRAYDSIDWGFLDFVMIQMGFGTKWRRWIQSLLSSARIAVLVNGSPTESFAMGRGLRQGCSLSPLLFNLVADALNRLLNKAVSVGLFEGVRIGNSNVAISHLQFADDLIIFCKGEEEQIRNIKRTLRCFEIISGLCLNLKKSKLYGINCIHDCVEEWAKLIGCSADMMPTEYLGLPLGHPRNSPMLWRPVVAKIGAKLQLWKAKYLSLGGRITLVKSVLLSIPIFFMSMYKMPMSVCNELRSIVSRFIWGAIDKKSVHWVSWVDMCKPKSLGGLGLVDFRVKNEALLNKWVWRFGTEDEGLWKKVISAKYERVSNSLVPTHINSASRSWWWRDITKRISGEDCFQGMFMRNIRLQLGKGDNIDFWNDVWATDGCLKEKFPRIFNLALKKKGQVSEFYIKSGDTWVWEVKLRRKVFDWELGVWEAFWSILDKVRVGALSADCLRWNPSSSGLYSSKDFIKLTYDSDVPNEQVWKLVWTGLIPPKVEAFLWQIVWGRVPVRVELIKRKVKGVSSPLCPLCQEGDESVKHLFFECNIAWYVWAKFCEIWQIQIVLPNLVRPFIFCWNGLSPSTQLSEFWLLAFGAIIWSIWLFRNEVIFKGKVVDKLQLFDLVKLRVGLWTKAKWPSMITYATDFIRCPKEALSFDADVTKVKRKTGGVSCIKGMVFQVDAARENGSGLAGIGGVLKDESGTALIRFYKQLGSMDITTAELLAIKEAMMILSKSRWVEEEVTVLSDCLNVVSWLQSPAYSLESMKTQVLECIKIGRGRKWKFKHVPREQNMEADGLAKKGIRESGCWCIDQSIEPDVT